METAVRMTTSTWTTKSFPTSTTVNPAYLDIWKDQATSEVRLDEEESEDSIVRTGDSHDDILSAEDTVYDTYVVEESMRRIYQPTM